MSEADETPKGADTAGRLDGLVGCCWPWKHKYTAWRDTHTVSKLRACDNSIVATGIQQERRCAKCGKLKMRIEWV